MSQDRQPQLLNGSEWDILFGYEARKRVGTSGGFLQLIIGNFDSALIQGLRGELLLIFQMIHNIQELRWTG